METHFVTTPIGYALKDDTLYIITGRKEHDLNTAKTVAAGAIGVDAAAVTATPPDTNPAMIRVLVMRADAVSTGAPTVAGGSQDFERVKAARDAAAEHISSTGFGAVHPRRKSPSTNDSRLPKSASSVTELPKL